MTKIKAWAVVTIRNEIIGEWRTPHLEIYNTRKEARAAWSKWNREVGNEKVKAKRCTISF